MAPIKRKINLTHKKRNVISDDSSDEYDLPDRKRPHNRKTNPWSCNGRLNECIRNYYDHIGESDIGNNYEIKRVQAFRPELYQIVKETRRASMADIVSPVDIYSAKIRMEDRIELIRLMDALLLTVGGTLEFFELAEKIKYKLEKAKKKYLNNNDDTKYQLDKIRSQSMIKSMELEIVNLEADDRTKAIILGRYDYLKTLTSASDEKGKLEYWLNNVIQLPFQKIREIKINDTEKWLLSAREILDRELYGMINVKEQLLIYLNNRINNPKAHPSYLGLIGPAGAGKTLIVRCISMISELPFNQISCGLIKDESVLLGSSYVYVGSRCGLISNILMKMGCKNGIIFFDEFDKIIDNQDLIGSMLHIIDPEQNADFRDTYFDQISIDLSSIWFIFAMNRLTLSPELNDRIYKIHLQDYSLSDKIIITKKYILPKELREIGLENKEIIFPENIIKDIVSLGRNDPNEESTGLRETKNTIKNILAKLKFLKDNPSIKTSFYINDISFPLTITKNILQKLIKS